MKISLEFNNRFDQAVEKKSEVNNRPFEMVDSEEQRKKKNIKKGRKSEGLKGQY